MRTKKTKQKNMEAVRQTSYDWDSNVMEHPIIDPNWRTQPSCSRREFMDELAQRVGSHYGLADIRDAQLIDPNWKTQPMRAWDDVYEDLCREVGVAFGVNDIREA